jgi:hypothetical protein
LLRRAYRIDSRHKVDDAFRLCAVKTFYGVHAAQTTVGRERVIIHAAFARATKGYDGNRWDGMQQVLSAISSDLIPLTSLAHKFERTSVHPQISALRFGYTSVPLCLSSFLCFSVQFDCCTANCSSYTALLTCLTTIQNSRTFPLSSPSRERWWL